MLEHIYIKNVVLIDEILIQFNKGLNILSGETGAGKSIILGSITFVLGGRATKDFIKKDCEEATVEALIRLNSEEVLQSVLDMGIEVEEDRAILISRKYTKSGRNICKINGRPVTLSMIKEISEKIIDIHGQHEHQSLLNPKKHIILLDKFCDENLNILKDELFNNILAYKEILNKISSLSYGNEREDKIDILRFRINEIKDANLKIGEEEDFLYKRKILMESTSLKKYYETALNLLYGYDETSALDKISMALNNIEEIAKIDNNVESLLSDLREIYVRLEDTIFNLRKNSDTIEHNPDELDFIEDRLSLIYKIKKKYGENIEDVLELYDVLSAELEEILNSEEKILNLTAKKESTEETIKSICKQISDIRKEKALQLEKQIEIHLVDLGMENTKFKIDIQRKEIFSQNGYDKVEFLIATNLGEQLKPLSKIASGGEMSRIMLSLKAVLFSVDNIEIFVFDEIDSGISGRTAQMVAEKMFLLSIKNQILCITHLPQIATMADSHFFIEKFNDDFTNSTNTTIELLDYEKTVLEIARMTGGAKITESTIEASKEMLEQAEKLKKHYKSYN